MIKVVLCDVSTNDIQLSKELLSICPSINIVGSTCSNTELLKLLQNNIVADVILLDITLPFTNSLTLVKDISSIYPSYKILVHSYIDDLDIIKLSISFGAAGFLYKRDIVPIFLEEVITRVHEKGYYTNLIIDKELFDWSKQQKPQLPDKGIYSITRFEERVLKFLQSDYTYKEIAVSLGMKPRTVEWHVDNIFNKLGVTTRSGAIRIGSFKS